MTRKTKEQICQEHSHVDKYGAADTLVCEAMQAYADQELLSLQDENNRLREAYKELLYFTDRQIDIDFDKWSAKAGLNPREY